jgi:uncharacterized membrane protein
MVENETSYENEGEGVTVSSSLVTLLFLGFAIFIAGIILIVFSSALGSGSVSAGGVIFVGPFPIAFGTGPNAAWLIMISLVIAVLMFAMLFVMKRRDWRV